MDGWKDDGGGRTCQEREKVMWTEIGEAARKESGSERLAEKQSGTMRDG